MSLTPPTGLHVADRGHYCPGIQFEKYSTVSGLLFFKKPTHFTTHKTVSEESVVLGFCCRVSSGRTPPQPALRGSWPVSSRPQGCAWSDAPPQAVARSPTPLPLLLTEESGTHPQTPGRSPPCPSCPGSTASGRCSR